MIARILSRTWLPATGGAARGRILCGVMGLFLLVAAGSALGSANSPIEEWPDVPNPLSPLNPLAYEWYSPYASPVGHAWVDAINAWYRQGTAAGLTQDKFRSYDNDHSSLRQSYPQMTFAPATSSYYSKVTNIYDPRVTFGLQSYGQKNTPYFDYETAAIIEYNTRLDARRHYDSGSSSSYPLSWYEPFYENNFFLVQPAAGTYSSAGMDKFTFLTPYYLHSIGFSGSDAMLLKPIVWMAAAFPPALKTRILRSGHYVPVLMFLYRQSLTGNMKDPAAHLPAYVHGSESYGNATATPVLDRMITTAHNLTHIPPIARFSVESVVVQTQPGFSYGRAAYQRSYPSSFIGALRMGETFVITLNLESSWKDAGKSIVSYYARRLRGWGTVEKLNEQGSRVRITIPWKHLNRTYNTRSDFLLLVNDGTYDSAAAYVSVKHIQPQETGHFGVPSYPSTPAPSPIQNVFIFYNNSSFDGYTSYATVQDDNAIATDKVPLLPGQQASFENYTSFSGGINGIMIDIMGLPGTPTASDFVFKMGNSNNIAEWATAPVPQSIMVRDTPDLSGSKRVTLIWANNVIQNKWLQVTVKATAATGLTSNEIFYFGNAIGETGNNPASARVDTTDEVAARQNPHKTVLNPANVENRCDFNRDGKVDTMDEIFARLYGTNFMTELKLIVAP